MVSGLREEVARRISAERKANIFFKYTQDHALRCHLDVGAIKALPSADALLSLGGPIYRFESSLKEHVHFHASVVGGVIEEVELLRWTILEQPLVAECFQPLAGARIGKLLATKLSSILGCE